MNIYIQEKGIKIIVILLFFYFVFMTAYFLWQTGRVTEQMIELESMTNI